jgi:hypothetical protein
VSDIDRVVRDALTHRAGQMPTGTSDPLPGVQRRAARIHRRRVATVTAPAVAILAVVVAFVSVSGRGDGSASTVSPADTGSATSSVSPTPGSTQSLVPSDASSTKTGPAAPTTMSPRTRQEALEWGLAVNPDVIREVTFRPKPQGVLQCGLKVLGESPTAGEVYAWIGCQDYFLAQGEVKEGAGESVPAVLHVVGTGAGTAITKVDFPRQASLQADIRRMFPAQLRDTVMTGNISIAGDQADRLAQAEQELAGQLTYQLPAPPGR